MLGIMLPAFLLAMYEKDGLPLEKVVKNIIRAKVPAARREALQDREYLRALYRAGGKGGSEWKTEKQAKE